MTDFPPCEIGQQHPCGKPARHAIAVTSVRETAWATERRPGGIVFLCDEHATTATTDWR